MFKKYFILFFKRGIILLLLYPKLIFYSIFKNKISLEKRYKFVMKIVHKIQTGFKVNYEIYGLENIPDGNNIVITPNHQSILDPMFLEFIDKTCFPICKEESKHYPYFKHIARLTDALFLDRNDLRQALTVLKEASNKLSQNNNMLIFLEGQVSLDKDKKMNDFKAGGLKPAYKNHSTILPVAIDGYYNLVHDKYRKEGYKVKIKFLKPIEYEQYKDLKTVDFALKLHDYIEKNVIQLRK